MALSAVELRPEKNRCPLEDLVRPPQLPVLLTQPPKLDALRRGHPRPRSGVDLGLGHPAAHRLLPVAQLTRHTRHRPRRRAQLLTQRQHHPHRVVLLLFRIPPRRRRRTHLSIHGSHARSNLRSLRKTVKMFAGGGPSGVPWVAFIGPACIAAPGREGQAGQRSPAHRPRSRDQEG